MESHGGSWSSTTRNIIGRVAAGQSSAWNEDGEEASLRIAQRMSVALHRENVRAVLKRTLAAVAVVGLAPSNRSHAPWASPEAVAVAGQPSDGSQAPCFLFFFVCASFLALVCSVLLPLVTPVVVAVVLPRSTKQRCRPPSVVTPNRAVCSCVFVFPLGAAMICLNAVHHAVPAPHVPSPSSDYKWSLGMNVTFVFNRRASCGLKKEKEEEEEKRKKEKDNEKEMEEEKKEKKKNTQKKGVGDNLK